MELRFRQARPEETEYAVECHCRDCHSSNNFRAERPPYEAFRAEFHAKGVWAQSRSLILKSLEDSRTMLTIVEAANGERIGLCWVVFADWFEQHMADINDLYVEETYRRQGVGLRILAYIEETARQHGANLLVSSTGVDNVASQEMHQKFGFRARRYEYQIWL